MSTQAAAAGVTSAALPNWAGEMRYVARQPIMNLHGHVHAYELLFRGAPESGPAPADDLAARTMLDNAVMFGLEGLTNGLPAFVKCSAESLTEELVLVLAPRMTVLSVPGNLEMTPRLLDCCRKLRSRGFRLALEDFTWRADLRPVAELADYIRVDFNRFGMAEWHYLRGTALTMVAKKVETQEDYRKACEAGFTLFQGGYFFHPVLLKKRKVPANRMLHFEIVRLLHHDPIEIAQVSRLVLRDAALTYRLLRLVNSPLYAIQQEVRSIESAIVALGEDALRRIVSLAVLSELNGQEPPEILHMALVRARFCELAAGLCRLDPAEQYLLGMISLLPAMLRIPIEELTPSLPLRTEICDALQGTQNPERNLLEWLESHERGDWELCDLIARSSGLRPDRLMQSYAASMAWAEAALRYAA
jgi:EAL and modified HD-GYP domain-containing signal transduction protein